MSYVHVTYRSDITMRPAIAIKKKGGRLVPIQDPTMSPLILGQLAALLVFTCLVAPVGGRVRSTNRDEVVINEQEYPSRNTGRYYYTYYISYFTPSNIIYATGETWSEHEVTVCENYEPYFGTDNGTVLGSFPCPMPTDLPQFKYCCGSSQLQYCCRMQDTLNFKLAIGLGTVGALGFIIAVLVFVYLSIKSKKKERERRRSHQKQMKDLGIPQYPHERNRMYSVEQGDDGYGVTIRFHNKDYYTKFTQVMQAKYPKVAWKPNKVKGVYEGKVTYSDGEWVSLVLSPGTRGANPSITVVRETAAYNWMIKDFQEIVECLPDTRLCGCLSTRKPKTFPSPQVSSKSRSNGSSRDDHDIRLESRQGYDNDAHDTEEEDTHRY